MRLSHRKERKAQPGVHHYTSSTTHGKYCGKYHEEGGRPITGEDTEYPLLAGQWLPYLTNTTADRRAGRREMPKRMKKGVTVQPPLRIPVPGNEKSKGYVRIEPKSGGGAERLRKRGKRRDRLLEHAGEAGLEALDASYASQQWVKEQCH